METSTKYMNWIFKKAVFCKKEAKNRTIPGNSYYLVQFEIVLYRGSY